MSEGFTPEEAQETKLKATSSVHDVNKDKPPFGSRFLTDESAVWSHNAWDHVPRPKDQDDSITASLAKQRAAPVPECDKQKYNEKPAKNWDNFYKSNQDNFFRNRKWLHNEFPELQAAAQAEAGPMVIAELGCGAGNAVFPLLSANKNPQLNLRAYDYSSHAVKLVQHNSLYLDPPVGTIRASVWDVTSDDLPPGLDPGSVDIVIFVFAFSALHPDEWPKAVNNIYTILKPGGLILFRDYGRHDLTQLRFKGGRLLEDNFYIRGDKTRVYFFELDELALIFTGSRAPAHKTTDTTHIEEDGDSGTANDATSSSSIPPQNPDSATTDVQSRTPSEDLQAVHPSLVPSSDSSPTQLAHCPPHPLFAIEQLGVDRRLLVNRKRQLKMYRVWMQGKFRKL